MDAAKRHVGSVCGAERILRQQSGNSIGCESRTCADAGPFCYAMPQHGEVLLAASSLFKR